MAKKIISRTFLVLFILALAAVPVLMTFMPANAKNRKIALQHDTQLLARLHQLELSITPTPSPIPTPTTKAAVPMPSFAPKAKPSVTPSKAPKPTDIASIIQDKEETAWSVYKSGSVIDSAFFFTYPKTWDISYKMDDSQENAFQFLFNQSTGSQVMTVQIYPYADSADAFIAAKYKNKLVAEEFGTIGNETIYRLSPESSLSVNDPIYTTFGSRGLILGKQHAYTISFDANTDHSMINLIEQVIWPTMTFK